MKKAIMTIAVGDDPMFEYTIRTIRKYAEKVGADFILKDKVEKITSNSLITKAIRPYNKPKDDTLRHIHNKRFKKILKTGKKDSE